MKTENSEFDVYKDMQARTNGEIYIGVVGPVRTGKSTFIKRFVRIKQARERRVVVLIEGIAAVATTSVPSVLVEKIL